MKLYISLICLISVRISTIRLKSSDYCRSTIDTERCTDQLNKYSVNCSDYYCAESADSCNNTVVKFLTHLKHYHLISFNLNLTTNLSLFYQSIVDCPIRYKFEASHVCLVGKNCNKLELNNDDPEKETTSLVWKRVKCSCPSKFNFECTRIVCARHLKACSSFKANKSIRLRKCDH